jgi:hypothetical protein
LVVGGRAWGGRGHVVNTYLVSVLSSELEYIFVLVVQLAS